MNSPTLQMRIPPHSADAEISVLGALLLDKDAILAVAELLHPAQFYDERHADIYECIVHLYEQRIPIDVLTVSEELKKKKVLKNIGGAAYLADLVNRVPTAAHVEHYAKIVKDQATKRSLMSAASKLVELSLDDGLEASELLDRAESEVFSLTQHHLTQSFVPIKSALADSFDRLDELHKQDDSLRGVPTGFRDLDNLLAGMQRSNLIILAARPGVGKCVTADTLITDPESGKRETIENIVKQKNGKVLTLDSELKLRPVSPSAFVDDGHKPVYEVKTKLGNKLEATAIHPLLTIEGWKKLEEISEGERIAVPRKIDVFGKKNLEDWKIKTLAYLIGDGGLTSNSPKFTNSNPRVLSDFCNSIPKFGEVETRYVKQSKIRFRTPTVVVLGSNPYKKDLRLAFSQRIKTWLVEVSWTQRQLALSLNVSPAVVNNWVSGGGLPGVKTHLGLEKLLGVTVERIDRINPVTDWLSSLGVMGKLAVEKEIPEEIFLLSKDNISLFLNRLFACEGSIMLPKDKGCGRISFSSSSYKLAEGVKHLLLRFGILSSLRTKKINYKGGTKIAYELQIMGATNILTFVNEIGAFGKEKKVEQIKSLAEKKLNANNFSKDTLPLGIWNLIAKEKGELSWREIYRRMGRPLSHNIHVNKRQLRRETLKEIAQAIKSELLINLSESDIYWDTIVSIKSAGIKHVYDLTVDKTHNFIANDIVVHNTTLAVNIAQHVAVNLKRPVGIFSLEMSKEELVDRLLVGQADIDAWKLKTGKLDENDFTALSNAMGELAEAPIYIDDTPGLSILEMRTKARRLQVEFGIDLLIVDYLQLAKSRNLENRVQEVSEVSQGMKNIARELKIPVLCLSQLSRAVEQRGTKRPQLADLRDSGSIEQDADVVMFLWREDDDSRDTIGLDIAKHRNGPLGGIQFYFKGDRVKFYGMEDKRGKR